MQCRSTLAALTMAYALALGAAPTASAQWQPQLGPAPWLAPDAAAEAVPAPRPRTPASVGFDPMDRTQVALAYRQVYLAQGSVPMGWGGSVATCNAGSTTAAYRQATIDRVNYYRVHAGLPGDVGLQGGASATGSQQAALMFSANQALSHTPPPSWLCWTQAGATAAGSSNIALGWGSDAAAGVNAVDLYMDDHGTGNTAVGHRRWILYPPQAGMDSGSIPWSPQWAANALKVIGGFGVRPPTPNGVAWPPRGYVPWQLLPDVSNRWSFSWPNANFVGATVSMTRNGVPLGMPTFEALASGYGDNTLVWRPQGVSYAQPAGDVTYRVSITGISGGGAPASLSYEVVVIDPYVLGERIFANGFER